MTDLLEVKKEFRNARLLSDENNFLIERLINKKPRNMHKPLRDQYNDLIRNDKEWLVQHLIWTYEGQSVTTVMGIDGSAPYRDKEVFRLGGPSKQAIAYFIVKKQFEYLPFLN